MNQTFQKSLKKVVFFNNKNTKRAKKPSLNIQANKIKYDKLFILNPFIARDFIERYQNLKVDIWGMIFSGPKAPSVVRYFLFVYKLINFSTCWILTVHKTSYLSHKVYIPIVWWTIWTSYLLYFPLVTV